MYIKKFNSLPHTGIQEKSLEMKMEDMSETSESAKQHPAAMSQEDFVAFNTKMLSAQAENPLQLLVDAVALFLKRDSFKEAATKNLLHLVGAGKLKSWLKFALAQPMAELTKGSPLESVYEPVKPPKDLPKGAYQTEEGGVKLYFLDLFGLEGKERMRVLQRLTERQKDKITPSRRAIAMCFSILSLKNLAPPLTFPELSAAVKEHQETLTSQVNPRLSSRQKDSLREIVDAVIPEEYVLFSKLPKGTLTDRAALLEERAKDISVDEYNGIPFATRQRQQVHLSSKLRSGHGLKAQVSGPHLAECGKKGFSGYRDYGSALSFDHLHSMSASGKRVLRDEGEKRIPEGTAEMPLRDYETLTLRRKLARDEEEDELLKRYVEEAATADNEAEVVALLEPLKVRTISIDSGGLRYLASRIQKFLWTRLKDCKCFTLTKGTYVQEAVDGMFRKGLAFVSGDYKGATDSIYSNVTDYTVRRIFKKIAFPTELRAHADAMARSVTEVILNYTRTLDGEGIKYILELERRMVGEENERVCYNRKFFERPPPNFFEIYELFRETYSVDPWFEIIEVPKVKQTRGQLMGNVLSFPVLCIINAAAYCHASQLYLEWEVASGRAREYYGGQGMAEMLGGLSTPLAPSSRSVAERKRDWAQFSLLTQFCEPVFNKLEEEHMYAVDSFREKGRMYNNSFTGEVEPLFYRWVNPDYRGPANLEELFALRILDAQKTTFQLRFVRDEKDALSNLPILVNGDDILFQATRRFYHVWSRAIALYGLEKSVGKNYFSPHFFTINSQLFISDRPEYFNEEKVGELIPEGDELSQPVRINTIWWSGLGPSYLQKRKDLANFTGKASAFYQDTRSFLPLVQKEFLGSIVDVNRRPLWNSLWLKANDDYIKAFDIPRGHKWEGKSGKTKVDAGFLVSRSLPVALGGLGLELNEKEKLTDAQKIIACRLNSVQGREMSLKLSDSPLIQSLMGSMQDYFLRKYQTVEASDDEIEYDKATDRYTYLPRSGVRDIKFGIQVYPLTDAILKVAPNVFPLWRTPPPDDLKFDKDQLMGLTAKVRAWALKLNKETRTKFASISDDDPTLRRITSTYVVKQELFPKSTNADRKERHNLLRPSWSEELHEQPPGEWDDPDWDRIADALKSTPDFRENPGFDSRTWATDSADLATELMTALSSGSGWEFFNPNWPFRT